MKSPLTGKEMIVATEPRSMEFRKETFEIVFHSYKCVDSGEQFTTTSLDELNINQVYNQYRQKYRIPFSLEIQRIREKYGLPASKMSLILGFGVNSYRHYEAGEMPSISNARLIQMIDDPVKFIEMVELCDFLDIKSKDKYIQKAQLLLDERKRNAFIFELKGYLSGNHLADVYTGYRNPDLNKFAEMVVFFSEAMSPFKTKMNKLLFYADFIMFKKSCFSISGMRYNALGMGPVPQNFQSIFEYLVNNKDVEIVYTQFPQGYMGEKFQLPAHRTFHSELFSEAELDVLKTVADVFKNTSTSEIIEQSHLEEAWRQHEKDKSAISYMLAFELKQIHG